MDSKHWRYQMLGSSWLRYTPVGSCQILIHYPLTISSTALSYGGVGTISSMKQEMRHNIRRSLESDVPGSRIGSADDDRQEKSLGTL